MCVCVGGGGVGGGACVCMCVCGGCIGKFCDDKQTLRSHSFFLNKLYFIEKPSHNNNRQRDR